MKTEEFNFDLPENLIAQTPIQNRALSRLLVMDKEYGHIEHKTFKDIVDYITPRDCLVINDTKVIPARLLGTRPTGGKVEVFLLTRKSESTWEVLVRPGRKARPGDVIHFGEGILRGEIKEIAEDGNRIVEFYYSGVFEEILSQLGEMPLPPYITEKLEDNNRYQTIYATHEGSVAAPTAGLHFTDELLSRLMGKGVRIARVTLHVGLGTFRQVKSDNIYDHTMHSEFYNIEESQAEIINATKREGGKIICVGTTSLRTLESCADEKGFLHHGSGWTNIFIYPGYRFKIVDELITNFHLPESTLIMLVSALSSKENILNAYYQAIEKRYRFFSFGDAMFIRNS